MPRKTVREEMASAQTRPTPKPRRPDVLTYRALARDILVVVTHSIDGWRAYIGAVAGVSHNNEKYAVAQGGTKLTQEEATALVPTWVLSGQYGDYVR